MSAIQVRSYRPGSLEHSGVSLSLVILRGALENLHMWAEDVNPLIGANRLDELAKSVRGWSVPAERAADHQHLCEVLRELRFFWPLAVPKARRELLAIADRIVRSWLADLDGVPL